MQAPGSVPSQETVTIAERIMSEALGGTVRFGEGEDLQEGIRSKEGVYGRMRFPTCWCVYQLPEHIPLRMEEAYRSELVKGCPEAADDTLFPHAVTETCVYWMIDWFQMVPLSKNLEKDRLIAAATDRQRYLMRCNIVAKTCGEYGHIYGGDWRDNTCHGGKDARTLARCGRGP